MTESIVKQAVKDAAKKKKQMDDWKRVAVQSVQEKIPLWKTVGAFHAALKHIEAFSTEPDIVAEAKRGLDLGEKLFRDFKQFDALKVLLASRDDLTKPKTIQEILEAEWAEMETTLTDEELAREIAEIEQELKSHPNTNSQG